MEDGVNKNNTGIPHAIIIIAITMFSLSPIFPSSAAAWNQANSRYLERVLKKKKKKNRNEQNCFKPARAPKQGESERGRNVCSLTSKPFRALLCSALQGLSDDLASTQKKKVINKSCPPSHLPLWRMPVLLSHGCNFLVQTFRLTKHRSLLPAGNAKRLYTLLQSSKSLTD